MALINQLCIVTGANSGIGKEVAAGLMENGAQVVLACRSASACEVIRGDLLAKNTCGSCMCAELDLSDLDSIRKFARGTEDLVHKARQPLTVLVNNAGVMGPPMAGGIDPHFHVNHVGPYLLTRLLLPLLKAKRGARVVTVASRAHYQGTLAVHDGRIQDGHVHWVRRYARSKLCNILFTAELQRRYGTSHGLVAVAASPGPVDSGLFRNLPALARWAVWPLRPFMRTPAQGADVVVHACVSPDVDGLPAPLFLHDRKPMEPSAAARDPQLARQLWEATAVMVGLPVE